MNLTFTMSPELDSSAIKDFISFLIKDIQETFTAELDDRQLRRFQEYFNSTITKSNFFGINEKYTVSAKGIAISAIYNLVDTVTGDQHCLEINPSAIIPNSRAKFNSAARLINNGNMEVSPYPIYDKVFQYFADNLGDIYHKWLEDN